MKPITDMAATSIDRDARHQPPLLVFVHIPKTAGTTMTTILSTNEPGEGTRRGANVFKGGGGTKQEAAFKHLRDENGVVNPGGAKILTGHFPLGVREDLPKDRELRCFTFLREPADRTLSHYFSIRDRLEGLEEPTPRRPRPLQPDATLEDALEAGYIHDNLHTRMLSGLLEPFGEVTEAMLERAKQNLHELAFFGLTERFDESLVLAKRRLGLRTVLYKPADNSSNQARKPGGGRVNTSRPRGDEVPEEVVEAAKRCNRYDIELYRYAEELFESAPERGELDFKVELAALRAAKGGGEVEAPVPADFAGDVTAWRTQVHERAALLRQAQELAEMRALSCELSRRDQDILEELRGTKAAWERRHRRAEPAAQGAGAAKKQARRLEGRAPEGARPPGSKRVTPPPSPHPPAQDVDGRSAYFEQAGNYAPYLGVDAHGYRFVVATSDRNMGKHLFSKEGRPEIRVLSRAVTVIETLTGDDAIAGRAFVDVGANIGTSTVPALVSHRFSSAVCCEPEEENHRLLRANLALNDLEEQVRPLRVGVSDQVGRSNLLVVGGATVKGEIVLDSGMIERKREAQAAARLADPTVELPEINAVEVELVTLDHLAETGVIEPGRVGMLWIDAEGHEGHVLTGAGTLTDRGVPIVLEFYPAGLEEHGGTEMIHDVLAQCYTHFVDIRRQEADQPRFRLRPVGELSQLADRFLDPSIPGVFTDLLLLKLDAEQASVGKDLPALLANSQT